jgi:tetratricopeptide (TPR) repeat protein
MFSGVSNENTIRYLFELTDFDEALRIVGIASSACKDKKSILYAHHRNTAGSCYYEMNQLIPCRNDYTLTLEIRRSKLSGDDPEMASILANMGNLEYADGNLDEALVYYNQAMEIRTRLGDIAANRLALSYLQIGRVHLQRKMVDEALIMFAKSEALFVRTVGGSRQHMAR